MQNDVIYFSSLKVLEDKLGIFIYLQVLFTGRRYIATTVHKISVLLKEHIINNIGNIYFFKTL